MEYNKLPGTDIKVSKICLGTMTWGRQNSEKEAFEQMDFSLDKDVNFFDTAELYPVPATPDKYADTEKIIGNWITSRKSRDKIILASKIDDANSIGDEPFQYYSKFKNISVAVDKKRRRGINKLFEHGVNLIILDDAFQHRKVIPTYSLLLSDYSNLYFNDYLLPRGSLRESKKGSKRADSIVITKCPENFSQSDKNYLVDRVKLSSNQHIFFSKIKYSEELYSTIDKLKIMKLSNKKVNVVTGIVNSEVLISFLEDKNLTVEHFKYPDHFDYKEKDILKFKDNITITTEKDYSKLRKFNIENLYYLPISVDISEEKIFIETIRDKII